MFLPQPDAPRPDFSSLDRRSFLAAVTAGSLALPTSLSAAAVFPLKRCKGCRSADPIGYMQRRKLTTLTAFMEAHLHSLWRGHPTDDPSEVADEVVRFASHTTRPVQQALCLSLSAVDFYSLRRTGRFFHRLSVSKRLELLNQGEYQGCGHSDANLPLVSWDDDFPLHTAVSSIAMMARLVTNSREPARRLIGFRWSPQCTDERNLVSIPPPPYPDLSLTYDVCVIGSGAGGALMAARAAEAGRNVIILEEGQWISPDHLVQRVKGDDGREQIWPARDYEGLMHLFRGAGVNLAGFAADPDLERVNIDDDVARLDDSKGLTFLGRMMRAKPQQMVNLVQAKVVGGGPYVNNAIHLEIEDAVWQQWGERRPPSIAYADLWARMQQIKRELGVTPVTSAQYAGNRSKAFVRGCNNAGVEVLPLPVSILKETEDGRPQSCAGCGADNLVDPFGTHTGGIHPYRRRGPNSYLMRAIKAGAVVAYETRALKLCLGESSSGGWRARHLAAEHRHGVETNEPGPGVTINARTYVLAAGALSSTTILRKSLHDSPVRVRGLGERLTANVATIAYAVFDQPISNSSNDLPEPGVAQCYYVKPTGSGSTNEPILENWFHYPGSLALALTGWFDEYARVMRKYEHISSCGVVVPTKVRWQNRIDQRGRVHLTLDSQEFDLLMQGIRKICRIYLAAATPDNGVTLYLPTKALLLTEHNEPLRIRDATALEWALGEIRCRGPEFLNLATTHLQGGNSLGDVVCRQTFRVKDARGNPLDNLYLADASILPAGCDMNPQLTVKALAMYAADSMLTPATATA